MLERQKQEKFLFYIKLSSNKATKNKIITNIAVRYQIIENKTFVCSGVDRGGPAWARGKAGPQAAERGVKLSTVFFSTLMDIVMFLHYC